MAEKDSPTAAVIEEVESPPGTVAAVLAGGSKDNDKKKKQRRGLVSRVWKGIFGGKESLEKRLQYLSKEENLVHSRLRRRAIWSRQWKGRIINFFVFFEVVAVAYARLETGSFVINQQEKVLHFLPMFLLPFVAVITYWTFGRATRMCDDNDQKTLERLRAERQAKINELKERTNYYTTQQLIQKYDLDPAAKAAAATVLASKLGEDTGLKVYVGDNGKVDASGRSNNVQLAESNGGLRNRKQSPVRNNSIGSTGSPSFAEGTSDDQGLDSPVAAVYDQRIVEHYRGAPSYDGGWFARIAALLVGEDPTQCYALICGNCHMHNGLARKEDFPYITYYCPHCHALNGSKLSDERGSSSSSDVGTPVTPRDPSGSNTNSVTLSEPRSIVTNVEDLPSSKSTVDKEPGNNLTTVEELRASGSTVDKEHEG